MRAMRAMRVLRIALYICLLFIILCFLLCYLDIIEWYYSILGMITSVIIFNYVGFKILNKLKEVRR